MISFLRLKLPIIKCDEKKYFLRKIKGLLYSLKKHLKILPLENSGDF